MSAEIFSDQLKSFDVCDFSNSSLIGDIKLSFFFTKMDLLRSAVMSWEVEMWYYFVLVLSPNVKLMSINYFMQFIKLFYIESSGALLAID